MILVDGRAGSSELIEPLLKAGLPVEEATLEFGDLAFLGRGEQGKKVFVGIEHKKVSDLISSLTSARLQGHQLLGMLDPMIGYDRRWLIIEGDWDKNEDGRMTMFKKRGRKKVAEVVRGAPHVIELLIRLHVISARMGTNLWPSKSQAMTVDFITSLYRMWTDKDLDKHKSHLAIYAPDLDRGLLVPMSDFRRVVAQIPCIGYRTSDAVEKYFEGSFRRMMLASPAEWAEIQTVTDKGQLRRLGASRAKQITEALA